MGESVRLWADPRPNWSQTVSLLRLLWRRQAINNDRSQQSTILFIALVQLLSASQGLNLPAHVGCDDAKLGL